MTSVEHSQMHNVYGNRESYFRSFCLAFINARGNFRERVRRKSHLDSEKLRLGLSKEKAHHLFRETASAFEGREKEKLVRGWRAIKKEPSPIYVN